MKLMMVCPTCEGLGVSKHFAVCGTCHGKAVEEPSQEILDDLELAAAVKKAFEKQGTVEIPCGDGSYDILYQKFELLDWFREQK